MTDSASPRYRAPALEKGLDILELMARTDGALPLSQVSLALGRSKGEIFRMLQVLEERGYIARRPGEDGYALTNRLFMLGAERPPMRGLLEVALPIMHRLAKEVGQSCHLAVPAEEDIVVIARAESPAAFGFLVRLGHRAPLVGSLSGEVLRAWSDPASDPTLDAVRARGFARRPSPRVGGVTDISSPVLQAGLAMAALTMPHVDIANSSITIDQATAALVDAAAAISEGLRVGHDASLDPRLTGQRSSGAEA